jgi:hypothetical protein
MAILTSAGITFGDATTQSTAATTFAPSGTVMLFAQTSAPTGWTKNTTTNDNSALRLVTGTASTGGSVAFTTAFASQTPSGSVSVSGSAGNTTLTTPQIPSHTHNIRQSAYPAPSIGFTATGQFYSTNDLATSATGGGGAHNHPLTISSATFSGSAINLAVQYVDVIRATKN